MIGAKQFVKCCRMSLLKLNVIGYVTAQIEARY